MGGAGIRWTDDPTFSAQYARIVEGLRKAGVTREGHGYRLQNPRHFVVLPGEG
jgi:hypothetical protein